MHFQLVANGLCSSLSSKKYLIAAAVLAILSIELWLYADQTVDIGTIRNYINDHGDKILFGHLSSSHDKYLKSSDMFVQKAVDKGIYKDSYDGKIVRKLCKQANWRDDLIVSCDRIGGGIGNLKTNLLGCARYAIEAGGTFSLHCFPSDHTVTRMVIPRFTADLQSPGVLTSCLNHTRDTSETDFQCDGIQFRLGCRHANRLRL